MILIKIKYIISKLKTQTYHRTTVQKLGYFLSHPVTLHSCKSSRNKDGC